MRREKIANKLRKCVVGIVAIALVFWIGYSAYNMYESSRPVKEAKVNYQSIDTFNQEIATAAAATNAQQKNIHILIRLKLHNKKKKWRTEEIRFSFFMQIRKKCLKQDEKCFTMVSSGRKW